MVSVVVGCTAEEAERVRPLAVAAYDEERRRGWPFLSDVLERALRGAAEEDRAVVAAVVRALVKYDRLLGFASGSADAEARAGALFALMRGETLVDPRLDRVEDATERLGLAWSFPDWIVDLLRAELGADAVEPALARMNEPAPRAARVNTLRTTRDACIASLAGEGVTARATADASEGIAFEGRRSPFRTQAFARGAFEMQDEASQLVAELVAPPPRSRAIDACAGAGGKTLALAARLGGKGQVIALDASEAKLAELRRRARRAGASNVRAVAVDLLDPVDALRGLEASASRVLVDAPCTGLGAMRRNPEARWRLRPGDVERLHAAQDALTRAAAGLVAPGGRLVYAACSFLPSEGERTVESLLAAHADFRLVTARDVLGRARTERIATPDGRYLRTWRFDAAPQDSANDMDGFFAAALRRAPSGRP